MSAARSSRAPGGPLYGRALLAVVAAYLMVLLVKLALAPSLEWRYLAPLGVFILMLAVVRVGLRVVSFRGDHLLLSIALFLAGLGLVLQFRMGTLNVLAIHAASTYALPLGLAALLLMLVLFGGGRARHLAGAAIPCAFAVLGVLAAVLALGHRFRGAVFLAGYLNPTEVVKILLVVYAAGLLTTYRKALEQPVLPGVPQPEPGLLLSLAAFWLLPMGLLVLMRDLGLIALLNATLLIMVVLLTGRWSYLVAGLAVAAAAGWALLQFMPHGTGRVGVWLNPFAEPTGRGWQTLQGLSAMYSGGLWGAGLGAGHPHTVPIAASDFIYAALAEEIGYVGCGLVLLAYLVFFYRGFRIADSLRDPFAQGLASGLITLLALQTLFNIGGVTKALPLTGLTLPFLSHGGSSLVTSFAMLGLLLALSDRK
jgi:cell division protein FtsW (lipid II flippase)